MIRVLSLDDSPWRVRGQWDASHLDNLAHMLPIEEVTCLDDALELVQEYEPDVVLLDWYMGEVTGDVVYDALIERWPDILYIGNSSIVDKFDGIVNADKEPRKLFDALIPLIRGWDLAEDFGKKK